jgi:hypothetical protein
MRTLVLKRGVYLSVLVGYAAYVLLVFALAAVDAGPPRWIDDLLLLVSGHYWTLASVLVLALPPFVVLQLMRRRLMKSDELDIASSWLSGKRDRSDIVWAAAFGGLAVLVACIVFVRAAGTGEVHVVHAAAAESGGSIDFESGARVEVHGFPARKALKVTRLWSSTYYVPLAGQKPLTKKEEAAVPPPAPRPAPLILVESQNVDEKDFEVDSDTGEVTVRGLTTSMPLAARVAGGKVGISDDHTVLYVRAGASRTRDVVAGVVVLLLGLGAVIAQLRRKKASSEFDREVARNDGAW